MKINIHAGHNPDGKIACGAVGLIKESTEARVVKDNVIQYLKKAGHTVYDCTCNNGTSQNDVLKKIVAKCNAHKVDLDVSIHFNSGANDKKGDGKSKGVEVLVYSEKSKSYDAAKRVCEKLSTLGLKNRGVKVRNDLYFLKHTNASALLIEVAFVDDKDDVEIFKNNVDKIAKVISEALINNVIEKKITLYKVTASALNIRKGAGTKYATTGQVYRNGAEVEIIKFNSAKTWGLTNKGWVSMAYLKKI